MRLIITPPAATHIYNSLSNRGRGHGIRVGVKPAGCSGMKYTLEYLDEYPEATHIDSIQFPGFVVSIAPEHCEYFENATLDYVKEGLNEGFKFINDAEKTRCGCGESFKV